MHLVDSSTNNWWNFRILRELTEMLSTLDLSTVGLSENAHNTLMLCAECPMAWKLAGSSLRGKLSRTYQFQVGDRWKEVTFDEKAFPTFSEALEAQREKVLSARVVEIEEEI